MTLGLSTFASPSEHHVLLSGLPDVQGPPLLTRPSATEFSVYLATRSDAGSAVQRLHSTDAGQTWSEPEPILESVLPETNLSLTSLADGSHLGLFEAVVPLDDAPAQLPFTSHDPALTDAWQHVAGTWAATTTDGGTTWSPAGPGLPSRHGGLQLPDGKLLLASADAASGTVGFYTAEQPLEPWTRLATLSSPRPDLYTFADPHVIRLRSGRLLMMMWAKPVPDYHLVTETLFGNITHKRPAAIPPDHRSPRSYLWVTASDDLGVTWLPPQKTPLWGQPPHLQELADGRVLATYGHSRFPYGQRACLSEDGLTWSRESEIQIRSDAPDNRLSYPSSREIAPGRILTVYLQHDYADPTSVLHAIEDEDAPAATEPPPPSTLWATLWDLPPPPAHPGVIALGDRRELFIDGRIVDSFDGTSLQLHPPRREGTAFKFDAPWEGWFSAYPTVIKDGDTYRLYYRAMGPDMPRDEHDQRTAFTAMAESTDGITWTRPDLGLHAFNGSTANNLILTDPDHQQFTHNFSPFLDTRPGVPAAERYKAIGGTNHSGGFYLFASADGIHWRKLQDEPAYTQGQFDSQNIVFWSPAEQLYVCLYRTWTGGDYSGYRTFSRATSPDFIHWNDGAPVSFGDTPAEHLYTNGTQPYFRAPHILVSLAQRFFPNKRAASEEASVGLAADFSHRINSSDGVLLSSRGGYEFDRTFMEAFIPPGPTLRDWIARNNMPAAGIVPGTDRRMWIYRLSHNAQPTIHLTRYSLRYDGFVSVHAPYAGGSVTTKPLTFTGNRLELNYATSAAGELEVELLDETGEPLPGFTRADAQLIFGDEISRTVTWQQGADVSALAGRPIRLRFHLRDGDLYAFRFFTDSSD